MLNIIKTLAFKTLTEAIVAQESANYDPISVFSRAYPDVIKEITENHPEYLMSCVKVPKLIESRNDELEAIRQSEKDPYKIIMARIERLEAITEYPTTPIQSDTDLLQNQQVALSF